MKKAARLLLLLPLLCPGLSAADKPNIIYIMLDDAGYGDVSCYGQKNFKTPNVDALAAGGLKFTQYYSGSTVCAPTRCCLMTGLHTGHAFVRGNREVKPVGQSPIPGDTVTVAIKNLRTISTPATVDNTTVDNATVNNVTIQSLGI